MDKDGLTTSSPRIADIRHTTVMLREAVEFLMPRPGGLYIDGTVGGGGHAEEILRRSGPDGILIGLDRDNDAVVKSRERLAGFGSRAIVIHADFGDLEAVLTGLGYKAADGVLLDLGVSWFQLKNPERGFSFMMDGPLDMRMDRDIPRTAADLVNELSTDELRHIIREYGEEPLAGTIARALVSARKKRPITRTKQLAEIIEQVFPKRRWRIHPATRTFQALRIAVNDELGSLRKGLDAGVSVLKPGGRIVVISFHSLEDRIVKQAFAAAMRPCVCPPRMPVCACGRKPLLKSVTRKLVLPAPEEVSVNPAARSAKLRAAEKI